jgi:hypothetical protein
MLDNLRDQASFQDDQEPADQKESKPPRQRRQLRSIDEITHMTARQRFALAVMLLIVVCLLGTMLLIIGGKVVLPFVL